MIFYYSGASSANNEQNQPERSLGGYISSSLINNGVMNAIFSTVSKSVVEKNKRDTRLIVLRNTSSSTIYNLKIYIDNTVEGNHSNIKMAAVAPAIDNCGNGYFEQIGSTEAIPYQCTLEDHYGAGNAIAVDSVASGEYIGIWLSRTILTDHFPTANGATNGISDAAIAALEDAIANPITEDNSNLVLTWDASTTTTTTTTP